MRAQIALPGSEPNTVLDSLHKLTDNKARQCPSAGKRHSKVTPKALANMNEEGISMHSILVKDYMAQNPHAIKTDAVVKDVVTTLINFQITGAPVVDDGNTLVGFVSEQDCMQVILNDTFFCEDSAPVTKVMSTEVKYVTPETSIVEVAEKMALGPPKNYPVVEYGKLVGLISRRLILKALLENNEDCYIHT